MAVGTIAGTLICEAWNQASMIALVKKFDRARLSTDFRGKEAWQIAESVCK